MQESSIKVQGVINEMKDKTNGKQWDNVNKGFEETVQKEQQIQTAAELVAKINELCKTLAKLDPLQYADSCRPKSDSPTWMKEQDKRLTKEQEQQAQVFFDKLSQCFDNPKQCDCKGMGVQKFEDFCTQQNALAIKEIRKIFNILLRNDNFLSRRKVKTRNMNKEVR